MNDWMRRGILAVTLLEVAGCAAAIVGLRGTLAWQSILLANLPLRGFYNPDPAGILLVYGAPVALGILAAAQITHWRGRTTFGELYACSLLLAVAYITPMLGLLDVFRAQVTTGLALLEYFTLLPALLFVGLMLPRIGQSFTPLADKVAVGSRGRKAAIGVALLVAGLAATLAAAQVLSFPVPQGADTYAAVASTNGYTLGRPFGQDTHFLEERVSYYPPGAEALMGALSIVSGVPAVTTWQVLAVLVAPLLVLALCLPLVGHGPRVTACAGLLILCWDQVLFIDQSGRHMAFLVVAGAAAAWAAAPPGRPRVVAAGACVALASAIHFSILAVALGSLLLWGAWLGVARWQATHPRPPTPRMLGWRASGGLLLTATALSLACAALLYGRIATFGSYGIGLFSEVGLGATRPLGFASLLLGPVLVAGPWLLFSRSTMPIHRALAALVCVYGIVLFFFLHLWSFYHRYFAELATIGALLLFALLLPALWSPRRTAFVACLLLVSASAVVLPRQVNQLDLAADVEDRLEIRAGILDAIKDLKPDAVVLVHPDEILNRYIPPMTGRYIFCATMGVTAERQYEVVSKPTPVARRVQERNELALAFFDEPTVEHLLAISNRYQLDAIVLNPRSYNVTALADSLGGEAAYASGSYSLLVLGDPR